jgi:hypothetical protein
MNCAPNSLQDIDSNLNKSLCILVKFSYFKEMKGSLWHGLAVCLWAPSLFLGGLWITCSLCVCPLQFSVRTKESTKWPFTAIVCVYEYYEITFLSPCVCVCVCACACACARACLCVCVCVRARVRARVFVFVFVCLFACPLHFWSLRDYLLSVCLSPPPR